VGYQIVFRRNGYEVETLYWAGPLEETQQLARKLALKLDADLFRIIDISGSGAEVCSEQRPFGDGCEGGSAANC
jgi:hypothetical protein